MRKFILALPVVALMLAAGVLMAEAGTSATDEPATATVLESSKADLASLGWVETADKNKNPKSTEVRPNGRKTK